jgi:transposase
VELMSVKESGRLAVVRQVLDGQLKQAQAAQKLGVSVRQIKRLCRRVRELGDAGLISRRRGQRSNRRIADSVREQVLELVRQRYSDFGPELAREHLAAEHGFTHSTETLRGWMIQADLWTPKRRRAQRVHSPRQRRACLGELVQIDGSHHDWFEGRAPKCCLIAFIDDATGRVLGARFEATETTEGYLGVLKRYVAEHGAPLALYSDRHSIFTKHDCEDPKPTQFERALLQLDIESICAHSPQAKGRVERLFQTLQDRLCKAMRLAGISNMNDANAWLAAYLAEHNARFAVAPRESADMHRRWGQSAHELSRICALHHQRQLSAQGSCRFEGAILQIEAKQAHAPKARATVDIVQFADGRLELSWRSQVLKHRAYGLHEHLSRNKAADDKTLDTRVDSLRDKEQRRLARLAAEIEHQNDQRRDGIYRTDNPAGAPSAAAAARYGLRPARAAAASPA